MVSITCEFCDVLNIVSLLEEDHTPLDPSLAERLIRYYCNNPDVDNSYCRNQGEKEKCSFHSMLNMSTDILKKE